CCDRSRAFGDDVCHTNRALFQPDHVDQELCVALWFDGGVRRVVLVGRWRLRDSLGAHDRRRRGRYWNRHGVCADRGMRDRRSVLHVARTGIASPTARASSPCGTCAWFAGNCFENWTPRGRGRATESRSVATVRLALDGETLVPHLWRRRTFPK